MEDVSAPACEELSQTQPALSVCQGKINNELAAQKTDLPFRDEYILGCQLGHDLLIVSATNKKGKPYLDDDIEPESAAFGYEVSKLFGPEYSMAMGAIQYRFLGRKGADVHGYHGLCIGFLNMECRITFRAFEDFRAKMQNRLFWE